MKIIWTFSFMEFWIKNSVKKFDLLTSKEIKWTHQASGLGSMSSSQSLFSWQNKQKILIKTTRLSFICWRLRTFSSFEQEIEWAHHMAWGRWAHSQSSFGSWENFLSLCPTRGGNPAATSWKNDYKERPNLSLTFRLPNRQFRSIVQYKLSFCIMSLFRNKMQTVSDSTIDKINHFDYRARGHP